MWWVALRFYSLGDPQRSTLRVSDGAHGYLHAREADQHASHAPLISAHHSPVREPVTHMWGPTAEHACDHLYQNGAEERPLDGGCTDSFTKAFPSGGLTPASPIS